MTQTFIQFTQSTDASNDFTQDDLVKYWIAYANSLTNEKIHLKNTMNTCRPVLKETFIFEVSVFNPIQKSAIVDCSNMILGHLSDKLNNNRIKMNIRIVEKDEVEMIYTAAEKFDYLSKLNPNIEKLIEIFNLTMD